MATIYRFIVEGKGGTGGNGKGVGSTKKNSKKDRGGVELNRYQRITTTLGNRVTGGMYSQVVRTGRALTHLTKQVKGENGEMKTVLSGVSIVILIQTILKLLTLERNYEQHLAEMANTANYNKLKTGQNTISKDFNVTVDWWSGRTSYNENK